MAKGKGLGRGLEAIFAEEVPAAQNTPVGIRLSEIEPNPGSPVRILTCWRWRNWHSPFAKTA